VHGILKRLLDPDIRPWTLFGLALVPILALVAGSASLWLVQDSIVEDTNKELLTLSEADLVHILSGELIALEDMVFALRLGYVDDGTVVRRAKQSQALNEELRMAIEERAADKNGSLDRANISALNRGYNDLTRIQGAAIAGDEIGFRLGNALARSRFELELMWKRFEFSFDDAASAAEMQEAQQLHNYGFAAVAERLVVLRRFSPVDSMVSSSTLSDAQAVRSAAFSTLNASGHNPYAEHPVFAGTDPMENLSGWTRSVYEGTDPNGDKWYEATDSVAADLGTKVSTLIERLTARQERLVAEAKGDQRINAGITAGVLLLAAALAVVARFEVLDRKRIEGAHAGAIADLIVRTERDTLTGLWNRTRAEELIEQTLAELHPGTSVVLAYVDLDEFKPLNDLWGHRLGDDVLRTVARRLTASIPDDFEVVRYGGDEFVLFGCLNEMDVPAVSDFGRGIIEEIARPMSIGGEHRSVSATGGFTFTVDKDTTADDLLVEADAALILAKQRQRGSALVYDRDLRRDAQLLRALPGALDDGEIGAHFQPAFDMQTGACVAVEALARWTRPDGEPVSPAEFIPLAESFGLMSRLTEAVLRQVVDLQEDVKMPKECRVWLNLSAVELDNPQFAKRFVQNALLHGADLLRLGVEITETAAIRNPRNLTVALEVLRRSGIQVAIDDFGNGYSPLGFLREIPFDVLKLDRSIVSHIDTKRDLQVLVEGIVAMVHERQVEVVAEGIERIEEFEWLASMGANTAQGFLLAKPLPKHELLELIQGPVNLARS